MTIASLLIDVAANTASLERDVKQVQGSLDSIGTTAKSMMGALGVAFSVGAVVSFGKQLINAAGEVQDLSDKFNISTTAVQEFQVAAAAGGATIDDVARAMNALNRGIADETPKAVSGLERLGLSMRDVETLAPDERLRVVAGALAGITDPAERAAAAQDLLGKSSLALGASLDAIANSQGNVNTTSATAIRVLDDLGDSTGSLWQSFKNLSAEWLAFLAVGGNLGVWKMEQIRTDLLVVEGNQKMAAGMLKAAEAAIKKKEAARNALDATLQMNEADKSAIAQQKAVEEATRKAAAAALQHTEAIHKLRDAFTGADAIAKAKLTIEGVNAALKDGVTVAKMSAESQKQINESVGAAIEAYARMGKVAPLAMRDLWFATIQLPPVVAGLGKEVEHLGAQFQMTIPQVTMDLYKMPPAILGIAGALDEVGTRAQKMELPKVVEKVKDHIGELAQSLAQLSQVAGGSFGDIVRGLATVVTAIDAAKKAQAAFGDGLKALKSGDMLSGIAGMASGILGMASAAISAGKAIGGLIVNLFGLGTAGRDAVKDFAASFGGFDALRTRLLDLGTAGEQLWINLTQGVGRNNPAEARRAIDAINAALAGQDAWMQRLPGLIDKYGFSWEEAGQKAKQAHLDEIARGLIQDFADLSKAGFDVTLITEKMSTAVQDYVSQAIRTGTEIPAAMKPLLQKMVDLGILTDAAGVKLENLDSLTFATTLTEGFKGVIDAIHELTRVLAGDLKPALEDIGRTVVTPTIKPRMDTSDIPGGGGSDGGPESFLRASSNLLAFPAPAAAASFTPRVRSGGGAVTVNNAFHIVSNDPRAVADEVSREIIRTHRFAQRLNRAS